MARLRARGTRGIDRTSGSAGEGGFALLATLALMAMFSVTIIALLGMTFTSMAATSAATVRANQLRAADGALEIAVNQIRMDPNAELGAASGCHLGTPDVSFDQGTTGTSDDVSVALDCCPSLDVACVTPAPVPPKVPATVNANHVALVGDGYHGALWGSDRWKTDCGAGTGPGCLPWAFGLGNANYFTNAHEITDDTHADLIYSGPSPLQFVGDVSVKRRAVALRNPTSAGSAIQVGGDYRQGDTGLFSAASGGPCGELSPTFAWTRSGAIDDLHDGPSCADASVAGTGDDAGLERPVRATAPQTAPASCPAGPVVTLSPGTYDAVQTAAMNRLFSGSCHKTFLFTAGDYWLDVNDLSQPVADRNALVFNDAGSAFVFGSPNGWDTSSGATDANFPDACQHDPADAAPAHDGVSVTLSSRTTIRHAAGRVAMCGHRPNGASLPIIWQDPAPADGWVAKPAAVTSADFNNPTGLLDGPDQDHTGTVTTCWFVSTCVATKSITLTGWGGGVDPGPATLRSATVLVSGSANNSNGPGASTRFDVYPRASSATYAATPLCSATFSRVPDRWTTVAFDLLGGSGNCSSYLNNRSQLYGAKVVMTLNLSHILNLLPGFCLFGSCEMSESLDFVSLQTNAWTAKATADHITAPGWNAVDKMADTDGDSANVSFTCQIIFCSQPTQRTITVTDFGDAVPTDPLVPTGPMASMGVVITGSPDTTLTGIPLTDVKLTLADGSVCGAMFHYMAFDQQRTYFDLLEPQASTPDPTVAPTFCPDLLRGRSATSLQGAALELILTNACYGYTLSGQPVCANYAVPSIDSISLSAASAGYSRPSAPLRITVNSDPASGTDARFNVFGPVSVPHNDVDVRWAGPVEDNSAAASTPVVGGSLVANGLGSDVDTTNPAAVAGLLCCSPAKPSGRTVRINARINGVIRGTALIELGDISGGAFHPGTQLTIVDWRTCGQEACT